jgi:hypothetical protein
MALLAHISEFLLISRRKWLVKSEKKPHIMGEVMRIEVGDP